MPRRGGDACTASTMARIWIEESCADYPTRRRETVGAAIERCARALRRARVHFGHGTDNARDEAAELVFFAAGLAHAAGAARLRPAARPRAARRASMRCCASASPSACRSPI